MYEQGSHAGKDSSLYSFDSRFLLAANWTGLALGFTKGVPRIIQGCSKGDEWLKKVTYH